jgi:uncharacterized membrane protein
MACYGLSDFVSKQAAAAGMRADHFLMAQAWVYCPTVVVYAIATHSLIATFAALWGSLAGLFTFVGFYYFIRSLSTGSVSTNSTIFRLNFIITVILAIALLDEPLTIAKIFGLALALTATWLLVGTGTAKPSASASGRHTSLMKVGIATASFGTATFFHALGLRHGVTPETLIVAQAAVFMPVATLVTYRTHRNLRLPKGIFRYSLPTSIALVCATLFLLHGLTLGPASVLVPIAQMGFIVAALLGILVLREGVTTRKIIGLTSALVALAVLATH